MQIAQLNLVIRLAGEQRDEAAQRLAAGRQQWQGANQQLEQLQNYQRQYIGQVQRESQQGIAVQNLVEGRRFIAELEGLIATQQQTVAQQETNLQVLTEQWVAASQYLNAVERLKDSRLREQQQSAERREQQLVDDLYSMQQTLRQATAR